MGVKRLELARLRLCKKCGRGGAELRSADGDVMVVAIDPLRVRELRGEPPADDVESILDRWLAAVRRDGDEPQEVVLDVSDGKLRGLLSCARGEAHDVISCTAEEGVALALRGDLKLYATEEALAASATRTAKPDHGGGLH
jgi:hypothetical protein